MGDGGLCVKVRAGHRAILSIIKKGHVGCNHAFLFREVENPINIHY